MYQIVRDKPQWPLVAGSFGIFLWAASAWSSIAGAYFGLLFMLIGFIAQGSAALKVLSQQAWFYWWIGLSLLVVIRSLIALPWVPEEYLAEHQESLIGFIKWLVFVPILAWWFAKANRSFYWILTLALVGFIFKRFYELELEMLAGQGRPGLGFMPNALGLYSGIGLVGLLVSIPAALNTQWHRYTKTLAIIAITLGIISLTLFLYLCKTRSILIGLILVTPFIGIYLKYSLSSIFKNNLVSIMIVAVIATSASVGGYAILEKRSDKIGSDITNLLNGQWDEISDRNSQIRLKLLRQGFATWQERPWLGWGADGSEQTLMQQSNQTQLLEITQHHNIVIEWLVRFGIVGSLLFWGWIAAHFMIIIQAYRKSLVPPDTIAFLVCAWTLFLFVAQFEYRLTEHDWRFLLYLLQGITLSIPIREALKKRPQQVNAATSRSDAP